MTATSFRTDLRAACLTVLQTVSAANPTLLPDVLDHSPESYTSPMGFVEKGVQETIRHDASNRYRTLHASVVLVNKLMSNDQASSEQDALVDLVLDAFTNAPHAVSGQTLIEPISVADFELEGGAGIHYSAVRIIVRADIAEGRF